MLKVDLGPGWGGGVAGEAHAWLVAGLVLGEKDEASMA